MISADTVAGYGFILIAIVLTAFAIWMGISLQRDIKRDMDRRKRELDQLRKDAGWDQ